MIAERHLVGLVLLTVNVRYTLRTGQSLTPCSAPDLSITHEGIATEDSGVSPDRTPTGRLT